MVINKLMLVIRYKILLNRKVLHHFIICVIIIEILINGDSETSMSRDETINKHALSTITIVLFNKLYYFMTQIYYKEKENMLFVFFFNIF